jgi:hypothetical protein
MTTGTGGTTGAAPAEDGPVPADAGPAGPRHRVSAALAVAFVLSDPLELVLPLVRRWRGRRGVQSGPALVAAANAAFLGWSSLRSPALLGIRSSRGVVAAMVWSAVSPLLLAGTERTVVLRSRSASWAYPLHGLLRAAVLVAFLPALQRDRRQRAGGAGGSS